MKTFAQSIKETKLSDFDSSIDGLVKADQILKAMSLDMDGLNITDAIKIKDALLEVEFLVERLKNKCNQTR